MREIGEGEREEHMEEDADNMRASFHMFANEVSRVVPGRRQEFALRVWDLRCTT